ncbi:hypothetical protein [Pararhodobacter sp. CCB-MM2]|uniref:hypothetical protein n=1 Tax=Pararhodobacter sp. CCB-MM2 TaxID=1786003 RepID=UPI00082B50ED|nr:hypothetical protein [Pararhodobacter sp. CCB-MM2]
MLDRFYRLRGALHMKSGAAITFTCSDIEIDRRGGDLTKIKVSDHRGFPMHVAHDQIEAVTVADQFTWFGLRR